MDDAQLLRYSRHVLLDEWGIEAQRRVAAAHAVVVGAGGLGSPALLYLAGAGVGRITVVDPDRVDLTNLQRQVAHTTDRIGRPKAESAAQAMAALNPGLRIDALVRAADAALLDELLPQAGVVLDCTDRFYSRQLVNRACVRAGVPLVWAAAVRFDAQLSVHDPRSAGSPCYACLFPPDAQPEEIACATMGVFAPLVGMAGVMQAGEALKLLAGVGTPLRSRLLMIDGRTLHVDELRVARRADCPVCGPPGHGQRTH